MRGDKVDWSERRDDEETRHTRPATARIFQNTFRSLQRGASRVSINMAAGDASLDLSVLPTVVFIYRQVAVVDIDLKISRGRGGEA